MRNNPHIVFVYPENFPEEIINWEIDQVKNDNIQIHVEKQENECYAAWEWIVPTFFVTYFLKSYFDGFLKEAGKDHYEILKSACKRMLARGKATKSQLRSATESTQKLSGNYNQSHSVSIIFQTKTERQIKMLFDNNLELSDWDNALEEISNLILEHYEKYPNDQLSMLTKELSPKHYYTIYIKINPTTKELEFHDDLTLIAETRNRS